MEERAHVHHRRLGLLREACQDHLKEDDNDGNIGNFQRLQRLTGFTIGPTKFNRSSKWGYFWAFEGLKHLILLRQMINQSLLYMFSWW